jgi:adenylate cyclase
MKGLLEKITKLGPFQITLLVAIISIILYSINPSFLNLLELKLYDLRFQYRGAEKPHGNIVIVKIDEESIRELGRWPWSREHWAKLIKRLTEWGVKVIGIDAIFAEKEPQSLPVKLRSQKAKEIPLLEGLYMRSNIALISEKAKALGFFNVAPDVDGTVRRVPLAMRFHGDTYPSLALQALREYRGVPQPFLKGADYGAEGIQLGKAHIPFLVNYRGGRNTFPGYSFSEVISEKSEERPPKEDFREKIVLVGATAIGIYDARVTPFDIGLPGVEIHATVIDNILRRDFILRPDWIWGIDIPVIILMALIPGLFVSRLIIPTLSPLRGASISVGFLFIYIIANWYFLVNQKIWINLIYPVLPAFLGVFVAVTVYQYVAEEREKRKIRGAFQFYVSPGVVNEILRDPGKLKLGGERKVLTVLFSDIRDFTPLSENLSPDTLAKLLNLYLTPMTDVVFKYQGTLDKYMGDAIMAIFGAPLPQNDHAEKACHTALDMAEALKDLQKSWEIDGLPEISIGIGINTGPMSVGNMGSNMLFDYTVVGDQVNLGSRIEKLNREYDTNIIISEFTHQHIKDIFVCRELDIVRVRGRKEPVRIFELLDREEPFHQWPAFRTSFERGLDAYRSKQWDEGIREFEEALTIRSDDGPAKLYLRRCRLFQKKSPSPKWDGIYEMGD